MANEKTVKFGGDISGLKSAMQAADKINKDYYSNVIIGATNASNSTKQQTEFIRIQTKATEENVSALRSEQETLVKTYNIEKRRVEESRKTGAISKEQSAREAKDLTQGLNRELKQGDLKIKDLDKLIVGLKGIKDEVAFQAMKEISADKKSVERQINQFDKAAKSGSLIEKYTPEEVLKLSKQKEILGGGDSESKKQQSLFGAILGAEAVKGVLSKVSQVGGAMAGATSGEQFLADALKGIPVLGEMIGGAVGRSQEESYNAQVGTNRLRGRVGRGSNFSESSLGYSIAETMPLAEQVVTALGSGAGYKDKTRDVIGAERAFSLDKGTLLEMLKQQRMQDGGDLSRNVSVVYNTMKEKGFISDSDTTQFQEILQLQNTLVQKQSEVMESTDPNVATGIISAFKTVGGSFGDARAEGRISQISNALAGPGNDFQQARNMQVLSKIKPGASLFETMEMQEKGINQEGFLAETLKQLEKETGGGEGMLLATQSRLGLGAGQTRKLVEKFQGDRGIFDKFGGSAAEAAGDLDLQKRGQKLTPEREQEQARISDAFVSGVIPGMMQVGKEFGEEAADLIKKSGIPFGEAAGNKIIEMLNEKSKSGDGTNLTEYQKNQEMGIYHR